MAEELIWRLIESDPPAPDQYRVLLLVMDEEFDMEPRVAIGHWADRSEDGGEAGWKIDGERRPQGRVHADMWMPLPSTPDVVWSYSFEAA